MVPISNIYLFFQCPSIDAYSSCALEIEFLQWHTGVKVQNNLIFKCTNNKKYRCNKKFKGIPGNLDESCTWRVGFFLELGKKIKSVWA